jgi:hypothetical protein
VGTGSALGCAGWFFTCFARRCLGIAPLHVWRCLVATHGFGSTSGAALNGAEVAVPWVDAPDGAAAELAARTTPTRAARMSTAEPAAAVAGEREMLRNLIIDPRCLLSPYGFDGLQE